jgi:hypothetical protein
VSVFQLFVYAAYILSPMPWTIYYVKGALLYDIRNLSDIRHDDKMIVETCVLSTLHNVEVKLMGDRPDTNLLAGHLTTHRPTARVWFYWQKGVHGVSMSVALRTVWHCQGNISAPTRKLKAGGTVESMLCRGSKLLMTLATCLQAT